MDQVQRWYVPLYLLVKLPLAMLAGAALSLLCFARHDKAFTWRRADVALILFMALFPVTCEVADRGPAFTGMRHFTFVVPLFAVLTGIGFDWLMLPRGKRFRFVATGAAVAVFVALASNAVLLVRLRPYQYLFYNPLVGGLEGASRRFATDYWVNIMPEAVEHLESYVDKLDGPGRVPHRYTVTVCGEHASFENEVRDHPDLRGAAGGGGAGGGGAPARGGGGRAGGGAV